jgi:hypothetical protein
MASERASNPPVCYIRDLVLVLFGRRQEIRTTSAPLGVHGRDVFDPDIEKAAYPFHWLVLTPRSRTGLEPMSYWTRTPSLSTARVKNPFGPSRLVWVEVAESPGLVV